MAKLGVTAYHRRAGGYQDAVWEMKVQVGLKWARLGQRRGAGGGQQSGCVLLVKVVLAMRYIHQSAVALVEVPALPRGLMMQPSRRLPG